VTRWTGWREEDGGGDGYSAGRQQDVEWSGTCDCAGGNNCTGRAEGEEGEG